MDWNKIVIIAVVMAVFILAWQQTGVWIPSVPVDAARQIHESISCNQALMQDLKDEYKALLEQNCINGRISIEVLDKLNMAKDVKDLLKQLD